MTFGTLMLVIGGTLSALMAGVYYTFNVAIVPALRVMKPSQHINAMQAINHKIENPLFFVSFFGPVLLLPWAAYLHRGKDQFLVIVAAAIFYIVGSIGITVAGNLPLNHELDKVDATKLSDSDAEKIRQEFQGVGSAWMRWHNLRTLATTLATVLVFIACLIRD